MFIVLYGFASYAYRLIFISHNYNNKYFALSIRVARQYFHFLISIILGSLCYPTTNHYHDHFHRYLITAIINKKLKNLPIKYIVHELYLVTLINYYLGGFGDWKIFFIGCFSIFLGCFSGWFVRWYFKAYVQAYVFCLIRNVRLIVRVIFMWFVWSYYYGDLYV